MKNQIDVRRGTRVGAVVLGMILWNSVVQAAEFVKPEEMRQRDQWVKEHLLDAKAKMPFSFVYDGQTSDGLMTAWTKKAQSKKLDAARTQYTITLTDPKSGLEVRCVAVDCNDFPAIEWTVYFKNTGTKNTPILKDIEGLDTVFQQAYAGQFVLNGIKGDWCVAESYQPYRLELAANFIKKFGLPADSGKSCDGPDGWPYYNLQMSGGGVIIAIGWPGQWASSFERDSSTGLRIRAGQEVTHLFLKPAEEIRTPLIAMVFWQGTDIVAAQNLWRRWYMAHNMPRVNGRCPEPMISIGPSGLCEQNEENCRKATDIIINDSKLTALWIDAGWYPCDQGPYKAEWRWLNTGTWTPDSKRLPNGFREFSDKLHAKGKKFILWFEPERVGDPNSWLSKNHPEWLLPGESHGSLLDEGNPVALRWLIDHVDGMIKSQGIDWYREDMNGGGPRPCWRKNDTPDRQGMTENLYVQGHLAFWDELRRRNPGLFIDSCASGGRRNDIETMRRAVPLCRTDFWEKSRKNAMATQSQTLSLASWLPYYGNAGFFDEPFMMRSYYAPSMAPWDGPHVAGSKKAYEECSLVAALMLGDYYPLTPYSLQPDQWTAWQFNRPEEGDGVVQAFRRPESPVESARYKLRGLDGAGKYAVKNLDQPGIAEITGLELMENGLEIVLKNEPDSALIVYNRIRPAKVADVLMPVDLRQVRLAGEIGRRIDLTVKGNLLKIDIEKDFLTPFRGGNYTGMNDGSGPFTGLGNLINSTVCLAAYTENEGLLARKKHLVDETIKTQGQDGYIGMLPPGKRTWGLWDIHEQGYIINGLVTDYRLFDEQRSLDAARKLGDYLIRRWPTKPTEWAKQLPCSEDLAVTGFDRNLLMLYAATDDRRYLDFCVQQLKTGEWNLDIIIGRRPPILGHVYSYLSHCLAQLELYRFQPDDKLLGPTRRAIDFMTAKDGMAITGGVGQDECWTNDQNGRGNLGETCATAYQVFFFDSLLRLQGDSRWGDLIERMLYNAAFGAQSPDGRRIRYYTPFEGDRVYFDFDTYCCPNNFRRLMGILPQLIYYRTDKGVAVNMYTTSQVTFDDSNDCSIVVKQETDYPSSGRVTLHVTPSRPATFPLLLRIPRWCAKASVAINGKPSDTPAQIGSFMKIEREWKSGDTVALDLPMEWRIIAGRKTQAGRAAIMRGPVIYTFNPSINPGIDASKIDRLVLISSSIEPVIASDSVRLGGTACRVKGDYDKADKAVLTLTLTEFPDPDGKWIYFRLQDSNVAVDDELLVTAK
jgi:alpha-galactosidase